MLSIDLFRRTASLMSNRKQAVFHAIASRAAVLRNHQLEDSLKRTESIIGSLSRDSYQSAFDSDAPAIGRDCNIKDLQYFKLLLKLVALFSTRRRAAMGELSTRSQHVAIRRLTELPVFRYTKCEDDRSQLSASQPGLPPSASLGLARIVRQVLSADKRFQQTVVCGLLDMNRGLLFMKMDHLVKNRQSSAFNRLALRSALDVQQKRAIRSGRFVSLMNGLFSKGQIKRVACGYRMVEKRSEEQQSIKLKSLTSIFEASRLLEKVFLKQQRSTLSTLQFVHREILGNNSFISEFENWHHERRTLDMVLLPSLTVPGSKRINWPDFAAAKEYRERSKVFPNLKQQAVSVLQRNTQRQQPVDKEDSFTFRESKQKEEKLSRVCERAAINFRLLVKNCWNKLKRNSKRKEPQVRKRGSIQNILHLNVEPQTLSSHNYLFEEKSTTPPSVKTELKKLIGPVSGDQRKKQTALVRATSQEYLPSYLAGSEGSLKLDKAKEIDREKRTEKNKEASRNDSDFLQVPQADAARLSKAEDYSANFYSHVVGNRTRNIDLDISTFSYKLPLAPQEDQKILVGEHLSSKELKHLGAKSKCSRASSRSLKPIVQPNESEHVFSGDRLRGREETSQRAYQPGKDSSLGVQSMNLHAVSDGHSNMSANDRSTNRVLRIKQKRASLLASRNPDTSAADQKTQKALIKLGCLFKQKSLKCFSILQCANGSEELRVARLGRRLENSPVLSKPLFNTLMWLVKSHLMTGFKKILNGKRATSKPPSGKDHRPIFDYEQHIGVRTAPDYLQFSGKLQASDRPSRYQSSGVNIYSNSQIVEIDLELKIQKRLEMVRKVLTLEARIRKVSRKQSFSELKSGYLLSKFYRHRRGISGPQAGLSNY